MNETDEEQLESLKKWWQENGRAIVVGVIVGAGGIFGWRFWEAQQVAHAEDASVAYHQVLNSYNAGDANEVKTQTLAMKSDYSSTPYAALAELLNAKLAIDSNELEAATESLQWVSDNSPEEDVRIIASLRLARVLNARGEIEAAQQLVDRSYPDAYTALVDEARGDILLAAGDVDGARQAYERALEAGQSPGGSQGLQMKLDDIAGLEADS
ncbi:MAG: tetratricopeptide repeat protein [Pseudomonadota bacterium]